MVSLSVGCGIVRTGAPDFQAFFNRAEQLVHEELGMSSVEAGEFLEKLVEAAATPVEFTGSSLLSLRDLRTL